MEKYYRIISSDELYHHGIKGQKWGIRRFQNEDGSLTAEGRERYGDLEDSEEYKYNKPGESGWKGAARAVKGQARKKWDGLSDKQKKAIKIGAAVAGTVIAAYAAYKVADVVNNKKAIAEGTKAFNQTVKNRELLNSLVENGKAFRDGPNAAYHQSYRVGNQSYSWTNYRNHPELIPSHLGGEKGNTLLERSWFEGETADDAFDRVYNSVRNRGVKAKVGRAARSVARVARRR